MSRIKSLLLMSAALFAACVPSASATVTYYVGSCQTGSYRTIGAALAATPAPDVVDVCPGTYAEQVEIANPVTLQGVFTGSAARQQVVITVPSGGLSSDPCSTAFGNPTQVCVSGASPVNITNIAVDGTGSTGALGVGYLNSSGTMNYVETRYQTSAHLVPAGGGIFVQGTANTITIENSNVHNFSGDGIQAVDTSASGDQMTVTIEGNTFSNGAGYGAPGADIFTQNGASVTIRGNILQGPAAPGAPCGIGGNLVGPCGGIIVFAPATGSISNNTVVGVGNGTLGSVPLLSAGIGVYGCLFSCSYTSTTMSVTSNIVLNVAGDGIQVDTPYGQYNLPGVTVENNTITQTQNGVDTWCATGNSVTSNTLSVIHSVGLANIPSGVNWPNTYYNVPTLYSICP